MDASTQQVASLARELALVEGNMALDKAIESTARANLLNFEQVNKLRDQSQTILGGYGPIQEFLDDETIEEIWVNQPNEVFIARSGVAERLFIRMPDTELKAIVERMLRHSGRRLDRATPFVDAALADGSRLHVVIPEITKVHWSINIRKFPKQLWTLKDLVAKQVLSDGQARFLAGQIRAGKNILVSGATQAGKTTLLSALIAEASPSTRLVTVEETFEIRSNLPDWVALQTRQSNLEGRGEVTLRRLVKESLRMRPQLLVVGEVREAESLDLLIAMNSGIPGLCTIHANSASDAIQKLCTLPLLAGANIAPMFVERTVASCVDLVVQCAMDNTGMRRVTEIAEVKAENSTPVIRQFDLRQHV